MSKICKNLSVGILSEIHSGRLHFLTYADDTQSEIGVEIGSEKSSSKSTLTSVRSVMQIRIRNQYEKSNSKIGTDFGADFRSRLSAPISDCVFGIKPSQAERYSIYLSRKDGRLM